MKDITLDDIKSKISKLKVTEGRSGDRRSFDKKLKQDIVKFHYKNGISGVSLSQLLEISPQQFGKWKKEYGSDQTAYIHGKGIRNDVRTKCLAVRSVIENGKDKDYIARKYNVTENTIRTWVITYEHTYLEYIESLPDGVKIIAKDNKMIYGEDNIKATLSLIMEQAEELQTVLNSMQKFGIKGTAIKDIKIMIKDKDKAKTQLQIAQEIIRKHAS